MAHHEAERAGKELDKAKDRLKSLMEGAGISTCMAAGVKVQRISRKGSIDYKKLAEEHLEKDNVSAIEEDYRRAFSESWKIESIKE